MHFNGRQPTGKRLQLSAARMAMQVVFHSLNEHGFSLIKCNLPTYKFSGLDHSVNATKTRDPRMELLESHALAHKFVRLGPRRCRGALGVKVSKSSTALGK